MVLHRTRHLFVKHMTAVGNAIRAHLAEFGIIAPTGRNGMQQLVAIINDAKDDRIPGLVRSCLFALVIQLEALTKQIAILDRRLMGWHRSNETCKRLDAIPGGRSCTCDSAGCQRCRSKSVSIGARLLGMDRLGAETELERRKGEARMMSDMCMWHEAHQVTKWPSRVG